MHPIGHTRLPRYVRGKIGTIARSHGVREFPGDGSLNAEDTGQHLYLVRFSSGALWGDTANPRDSVHLELYDSYLEPV
jgi:nitrile hydratase